MDFFEKAKELSLKGYTPEEIAYILGTDAGRVRIVLAGQADPENKDNDEYEIVNEIFAQSPSFSYGVKRKSP